MNGLVKSKQRHGQSKFVRFVTLPLRALGRARDFYVRRMISCAEGTTYAGRMGGTLPKSFSARSTRSGGDNGDDYSELIRAASVRSMGHLNEIDMLLKQHMQMRLQQQQQQQSGSNGNELPKSCSVGMAGFMGRIEEEKPSDLNEDGSVHNNKTKESVYPRSKSSAVAVAF